MNKALSRSPVTDCDRDKKNGLKNNSIRSSLLFSVASYPDDSGIEFARIEAHSPVASRLHFEYYPVKLNLTHMAQVLEKSAGVLYFPIVNDDTLLKGRITAVDTQSSSNGDVILPTTDGHPVKRVHYATEVNHDKKDIDNERRQSQNTQTAFAGVS